MCVHMQWSLQIKPMSRTSKYGLLMHAQLAAKEPCPKDTLSTFEPTGLDVGVQGSKVIHNNFPHTEGGVYSYQNSIATGVCQGCVSSPFGVRTLLRLGVLHRPRYCSRLWMDSTANTYTSTPEPELHPSLTVYLISEISLPPMCCV